MTLGHRSPRRTTLPRESGFRKRPHCPGRGEPVPGGWSANRVGSSSAGDERIHVVGQRGMTNQGRAYRCPWSAITLRCEANFGQLRPLGFAGEKNPGAYSK